MATARVAIVTVLRRCFRFIVAPGLDDGRLARSRLRGASCRAVPPSSDASALLRIGVHASAKVTCQSSPPEHKPFCCWGFPAPEVRVASSPHFAVGGHWVGAGAPSVRVGPWIGAVFGGSVRALLGRGVRHVRDRGRCARRAGRAARPAGPRGGAPAGGGPAAGGTRRTPDRGVRGPRPR